MYLLLLILIIGLKTFLCKGTAIGIFLLIFWIKGRQLQFNSDKWDSFFLSLPAVKVQKYAIGIYIAAAVISSAISYIILEWTGYQHSLGIAALILIGGLAITGYKWHTKGKDYLLKRYQEIPATILERKEKMTKMSEQIILREYQKADHKALENVVREAWKYDRFCSPETAAKMAKVYLNSCLTNQTFIRVAEINGEPVGVIMGKDIEHHKCPFCLRVKWLKSVISLYISKEGREILKIFANVKGIDKELLSTCNKNYKGELAFFAISEKCRGIGLGKKLFQTVADYMRLQNISHFYLFTDTSCNYPFYEHMGLIRRCEKKQVIDVKGEKKDMTFFIYDNQ